MTQQPDSLKTAAFNSVAQPANKAKAMERNSIQMLKARKTSIESAGRSTSHFSLHQQQTGQRPHQQEQMTSLSSSRKYQNPSRTHAIPSALSFQASLSQSNSKNQAQAVHRNDTQSPEQEHQNNNNVRQTLDMRTDSTFSGAAINSSNNKYGDFKREAFLNNQASVFSIKSKVTAQIIPPVFNLQDKTMTGRKQTAKRKKRQMLNRSREIAKLNKHIADMTKSSDLARGSIPVSKLDKFDANELKHNNRIAIEMSGVTSLDQSRKFSQNVVSANSLPQEFKTTQQPTAQMNDLIKEFRDSHSANKNGQDSNLKEFSGTHNTRYQQTSSNQISQGYSNHIIYAPQTQFQKAVSKKSNLFSRAATREVPNPKQVQNPKIFTHHPLESHMQQQQQQSNKLQKKINKSNRVYSQISQIRKSFEKSRPDVENYEEPKQSRDFQLSITENKAKPGRRIIKQQPTTMTVDQSYKASNNSLNQINNGSTVSKSAQHVSAIMTEQTLSEEKTIEDNHQTFQIKADGDITNKELMVQNLVITNANLSNCNVFIQNSTTVAVAQQHQPFTVTDQQRVDTEQTLQSRQRSSSPLGCQPSQFNQHMSQTGNFKSDLQKQKDKQKNLQGSYTFESQQNNMNKRNQKNARAMSNHNNTRQGSQAQVRQSANTTSSRNQIIIEAPSSSYQAKKQSSTANQPQSQDQSAQRTPYGNKRAQTANKTQNNQYHNQQDGPPETTQSVTSPNPSSITRRQATGSSSKMFMRQNQFDQAAQADNRPNTINRYYNPAVFNQHKDSGSNTFGKSSRIQTPSSQQSHLGQYKQTRRHDVQSTTSAKSQERRSTVRNIGGNQLKNQNQGKFVKSPSTVSLQTQQTGLQENIRNQQRKLTLKKFMHLADEGPLGVGHFGKVWLVKYVPGNQEQSSKSQLLIQQQDGNAADVYNDQPSAHLKIAPQKSSLSSLHTNSHKSLGTAAHELIAARNIDSILPLKAPQSQYALKMVEIQQMTKQKQIEHLYNERDILSYLQEQREQVLAAHCFPKLYATFKSEMHIQFLMEPIVGMTLFEFQKEQVCIKLEHVKFFAAKTLVLLDYLHQQKIIYRDLKTENIMIDKNTGELKLVDFGFAKDLSTSSRSNTQQDRTYTKCGTPGYTAPEVLLQEEGSNMFNIRVDAKNNSPLKQKPLNTRKTQILDFSTQKSTGKTYNAKNFESQSGGAGYSYPADVWSWGCLVCELIGGFNPFQGQSVQETFENIQRININWPKNLDSASNQMLQAIFQRDPALRPTLQSLKRSSFFTGVNWNHLESTFEQVRYQTRSLVQQILARKGQNSPAPQAKWIGFKEDGDDSALQFGRLSPHRANARRKLTDIQIKTIHDVLSDF